MEAHDVHVHEHNFYCQDWEIKLEKNVVKYKHTACAELFVLSFVLVKFTKIHSTTTMNI